MRKFRIGMLICFLLAILLAVPAMGEETADPAEAAEAAAPYERWLSCDLGDAVIYAQLTQYGDTLFLPSHGDVAQLALNGCGLWQDQPLTLKAGEMQLTVQPGEPVDLTALFPDGPDEEGVYALTVSAGAGEEQPLRIRRSANLASLYITSADPVNRGRAYVDGLEDPKSDPITDAALLMLDENGEIVYDNGLRELRGRGNTTWGWGIKKPYQIKLEKKTDLLQSGDEDNKERTWLLMAESFDVTLAHNMLTLSLGQEMGIPGTPEYRPADLYYDGDYCGFYLVCEKVNVKPGRLSILEMDDIIEEKYPQASDGTLHPVVEETTEIGSIRYVSGIDTAFGRQGAYLVELDMYGGYDEESMFQTANGDMYEIRSPEYLGREDVMYVQRLVNDLVLTIENGGVHPEDGRLLEELIDIDSLCRYLTLQQFAKTCDFGYTSTYLYLPEGSTQFKAGPLWDFDVAYAMRDTRPHEGGIDGYVAMERWVGKAMDVPAVQETMFLTWRWELEPLIAKIVLAEGTVQQGSLRSLEGYYQLIEASRRMNYDLWQHGGRYLNLNYDTLFPTYDGNWDYFASYIKERSQWLTHDTMLWSGYEIDLVDLTVTHVNADVLATVTVENGSPYQRTEIAGVEWSVEPDPDIPWRNLYTGTVTVRAREGSRFSGGPVATANGALAMISSFNEQEMTVVFTFSGPKYEPAVYDDVDFGLLFNYDYYVDQYPELVEEYGDDPYAILENYVYYDLPVGVSAIETFDFERYYEKYDSLLEAYFFSDTYESTLYYLDNDQEELMLGLGERIKPAPEEFRLPEIR